MMTGIIGVFSKGPHEACRAKLHTMVSSIEGGTQSNDKTYEDRDRGVYFAGTSIENTSDAGLFVFNETKDIALVLFGGVHLDAWEISKLKARGHAVSETAASALVHLYEEKGINFINEMNGWFCGLLDDRRTGSSYVFNDRFGMRRVFIYVGTEGICVASRARPILAAYPETRAFDPSGLSEYLTCGCTLGRRSLFREIQIMPAASLWRIEKGVVENKTEYFDHVAWESQEPMDLATYQANLEEEMKPVVREYGYGPAPIGISLTGGLDTRMVVACLDMEPGKYPCYTFGSMYRDTFDVKVARRVADSCGQTHSTLVLGRDFLADFPRYLERGVIQADGYMSLTAAAALYVNSLARQISPVRLTGNYGSELFRSVRAFKSNMPKTKFFISDLEPLMLEAVESFKELEKSDPLSFVLFLQAPCLGYGLLSVEGSQVEMRTPFMDNRLAKLAYQGPRSYAAGFTVFSTLIRRFNPVLADIESDLGYLGDARGLARTFRRGYYQGLFKAEYWSSHGMPHWVARWSKRFPWASPERVFLGRHKYQHFRKWTRGELSEFMKESLMAEETMPDILIGWRVAEILNSHIKGQENHLDELEKILTIVVTSRLFFRGK
jgi:asparagine synthase (glutamine-hydrolysing)